jgi:RES domain-containing protein
VRVWRIASARHAAFDGEGGRLYGSRWTPRGLLAVFASATLSLAALERFVHTDPGLDAIDLVSVAADIPASLAIESIQLRDLPAAWRTFPASPELAAFGERWLRAATTAVLSVPSALIPHERNFVLNPAHAAFARLTIHPAEPFSFDPRMWKEKP